MEIESIPGKQNDKYIITIKINGVPLLCHVDLGSQCTLIRKSEALSLNLQETCQDLPLMRGLGGSLIEPTGCANVMITVQGVEEPVKIYVVEDYVLTHPVLLGHSFTERPNITITKTPSYITFERDITTRVLLKMHKDVILEVQQMRAVTVTSEPTFSGKVYVNGTVRGTKGKEFYLLPGDYEIRKGEGHLLV